jgi:hypothetical protein
MTIDPLAVAPTEATDHPHSWHLRAVDYDDGQVSNRYECDSCDAVWFT